jgi:hypothetical protein
MHWPTEGLAYLSNAARLQPVRSCFTGIAVQATRRRPTEDRDRIAIRHRMFRSAELEPAKRLERSPRLHRERRRGSAAIDAG